MKIHTAHLQVSAPQNLDMIFLYFVLNIRKSISKKIQFYHNMYRRNHVLHLSNLHNRLWVQDEIFCNMRTKSNIAQAYQILTSFLPPEIPLRENTLHDTCIPLVIYFIAWNRSDMPLRMETFFKVILIFHVY